MTDMRRAAPRDRGPLARSDDEQPSGSRPQDAGPWSSRGYLPHFDAADIWQAITYRLADSMPRQVIARMEAGLVGIPDDGRGAQRRKRIEAWINAGHGSCILGRADVAALILETRRRFAGERYDLSAWVIMPNHVHVLIRVNPGWPLSRIVASWKSYTSKRIMAMTGLPAPIWWPDYWDRYIRSDEHWLGTQRYIEGNPVAAGLVREAAAWRWSSAGAGT